MRRITLVLALTIATVLGIGSPAAAAPTGSAQRNVLIVYVQWPGAPKDLAVADVSRAVGVTAHDWFRKASHQRFGGWKATTTGPVTITTPRTDSGACGSTFLSDIRNNAANAGVRTAGYDAVLYYFGKTSCQWLGAHSGDGYLHGTTSPHVVHQLLGRQLGLARADGLRCRTGKGVYVTLSSLCSRQTAADPFNVMGVGDGTFSAIQQADLGWIDPVWASAGTARYRLAPIDATSTSLSRGLAISAPNGVTMWVEYRGGRVLVYRQGASTDFASILLDMHPGTGAFDDAGLVAGETYKFPDGNRIKVVRTETDRTVVEVSAQP